MLLSVLVPAGESASELSASVELLHAYLSKQLGQRFEIVVIPTDNATSVTARKTAYDLAQTLSSVRCVAHHNPIGLAAAFRTGFAQTSGKWIALCDPAMPFDERAFELAFQNFSASYDLISTSRIHVERSVSVTPQVRARLARRKRERAHFNAVARRLLPLTTSDTHAGLKFLSRRLAENVFAIQTYNNYLFDFEIFLVAQCHGYQALEIPVRHDHRSPRSSVQALKRAANSAVGLAQIAWRYSRRAYHPCDDLEGMYEHAQTRIAFSADDWGLSPGINDGILRLAQRGVIKRVSILANGAHLHHGLIELMNVKGVELGLHFNMTLGSPTTEEQQLGGFKWLCDERGNFLPLRKQLINFCTAKVFPFSKRRAIFTEIARAFEGQFRKLQAAGIPLSYFDGHHHIHLAPFVLPALKEPVAAVGVRQTRLLLDPALLFSSRFILYIFSALAAPTLEPLQLEALSCIYPRLSQIRSPRALMAITSDASLRYEIITHPALQGDLALLGIEDSYDGARVPEYLALARFGRQADAGVQPVI